MISFKKNIIVSILMVAVLLSLNGCTNNKKSQENEPPKQTTDNPISNDTAIMDKLNIIMQKADVTTEGIIKFMDENIASLSKQNASTLIMTLENSQKLLLAKMQDTFAENENIQKMLAKDYQGSLTESYINGIQEKVARDSLLVIKNSGLKIETAEGVYYPVIDYGFFKKYRANVSPDTAAYIDVMAIESDKTPAKDAALRIGWDEIIIRASNQEDFLKNYGNSTKAEDVRTLLKKYLVFALYGANNTPLFSYENKEMVPGAKQAYLQSIIDSNHGSFSKIMTEYIDLLKKNDYKLTKEVDDYRKQAVENFR